MVRKLLISSGVVAVVIAGLIMTVLIYPSLYQSSFSDVYSFGDKFNEEVDYLSATQVVNQFYFEHKTEDDIRMQHGVRSVDFSNNFIGKSHFLYLSEVTLLGKVEFAVLFDDKNNFLQKKLTY